MALKNTQKPQYLLNWSLVATALVSCLTIQAFELPHFGKGRASAPQSRSHAKSQPSQLIVIGIDGLSYQAFRVAQSRGLFKEFGNVGAHVSTYPSMTDLAWASVMQTPKVFGNEGRIKSVEATYFDESTNSVSGDPRDYYRRLAFPKYYLNAFEHFFNPYAEGLMYFPTAEVPKLEVRSVIDDLISAKPKPLITGYIGAVDSLAHTQKDQLFVILETIDSELRRLISSYQEKGISAEIVLLSDHGNIGNFAEGSSEQQLTSVDLAPIIKGAGFNYVQQLLENKDVAIPLLALGSWAPVYVKDRKNIIPLINQLLKETWFDLATYLVRNNDQETSVMVINAEGRAMISWLKKNNLYYYRPLEGNPLQIPTELVSYAGQPKPLTEKQALLITSNSKYPDSIFRIASSATQEHFDYPDFIITLKDGYYIKGPLDAYTQMYRTHGSLSAGSSFGVMTSTRRKVPGMIRAKDILPFLGIDPSQLFGQLSENHHFAESLALNRVRHDTSKGVATGAGDYSQKRVFQHLSRFVSDSRPYFVVSEMAAFMAAFNFDPFKKPDINSLSPLNFDISKFDVTSFMSIEDIGAVTDAVLQNGDLGKIMKDARVQKVKDKFQALVPTKTAQMNLNEETSRKVGLPTKRAVMKLTQMPYLLQKSIVVQELPYISETRDLNFSANWIAHGDAALKTDDLKDFGANLFAEVLRENQLEDKLSPEPITKLYNQRLPKDITIVYLSGIYNSIFDREIFSLGLNAISDDLGLRVIAPPVYSTCSSDYNANIITEYLKEDTALRVARGHNAPKYIMLGYSKGGVDALAAFAEDPQFMSSNVVALVTIAAPLQGSTILNKTDIPFALVSALSAESGPEICKSEKSAAKSINPVAMQRFWRKNEKALLGLTRYFSLTFASTPEDSHIWMKATKLIAQFDEANDGVVTVSSSKFPPTLKAVDLGTLSADHLAGILSSNFNQKDFMKAIVNTMAEIQIADQKNNFAINSKIILEATKLWNDKTYDRLSESNGNIYLHKISFLKPEHNFFPSSEKVKIKDLLELNHLLFPPVNDPADDYEPKVKLAKTEIKFDPYGVLDVSQLGTIMGEVRVEPTTHTTHPNGIDITYNHTHMVHFRMDHQFSYESRSPGGLDDNPVTGYVSAKFNGEDNWALMRSVNNSIRMTTLAYRFKPQDFPKVSLALAVTKGVKNADPVKGKTGIDDSAFQVWFSIREKNQTGDRALVDPKKDKIIMFGYYWGDPIPGESRKPGDVFEDWYSNKNLVFTTLPESKMLLLNDDSMLGKPQNFQRNLFEDFKKAFPGRKVEDMEIVAITIQHDSNDAKDSSEAYFRSLKFLP
jgi:hypothetical protein